MMSIDQRLQVFFQMQQVSRSRSQPPIPLQPQHNEDGDEYQQGEDPHLGDRECCGFPQLLILLIGSVWGTRLAASFSLLLRLLFGACLLLLQPWLAASFPSS